MHIHLEYESKHYIYYSFFNSVIFSPVIRYYNFKIVVVILAQYIVNYIKTIYVLKCIWMEIITHTTAAVSQNIDTNYTSQNILVSYTNALQHQKQTCTNRMEPNYSDTSFCV